MKITSKITILLFILIFPFSIMKGQSEQNTVNFITPEASALMKSIDYPISHLTGIPDINIPLYTISSGKINLPINIGFHIDSYARVNQMPGSPGAGWDLSPNLQITRLINGLDDFKPNGYYTNHNHIIANYNGEEVFPSKDKLWQIQHGIIDEEPDKFYYSLLGKSGVFYFQKQSNGEMKAISVPYTGVKINYSGGNFTITDTDGCIYSYTALDFERNSLQYTPMGWKCTCIKTAGGIEEIRLKYDIQHVVTGINSFSDRVEIYDDWQNYSPETGDFALKTWNEPNTPINETEYPFWKISGPKMKTYGGYGSKMWFFSSGHEFVNPLEASDYNIGGNPSRIFKDVISRKLSEIEFRGGNITFSYTDNYKLNKIVVKNRNNVIEKNIYFNQLGSDYSRYLKSISIDDQTYMFEYGFEHKGGMSTKPDFWGYEARPPGEHPMIPYHSVEIQMGNHAKYFLDQANINDNIASTTIGSQNLFEYNPLQRKILTINYPTGGKTAFFVGQNQFEDSRGEAKGAGGYRIEKISYHDTGASSPVKEKIFRYGSLVNGRETGLGKIKFEPDTDSYFGNTFTEQRINYYSGTQLMHSARKRTFLNGTIRSLNFENGSSVNYNTVTEYEMDMGANTGKTVYLYDLDFYTPAYASPTDPYPLEPEEWDLAPLKSITYYRSMGNGAYDWIKSKKFFYNKYIAPIQTFCGKLFVAEEFIHIGNGYNEQFVKQNTIYNYKSKGIKTGCMQLIKEIEENNYGSGNIVKEEIRYYYDNPSQIKVSRIEKDLSDGRTHKQYFLFPEDFLPGDTINFLINKNIVSKPIESINTVGNKLTSASLASYNDRGEFLTQDIIDAIDLPVSSFKLSNKSQAGDFNVSTPSSSLSRDYHYKWQYANLYDNHSNVLSVSNIKGDKVVYLWGYNYQYPIAEIKGKTYEEVRDALGGQTAVDNLASSNSPAIESLSASLRNAFQSQPVLVTCYAYRPLVGISMAIDSRGVKTTYEYDDFGRLEWIKDMNGNIIESYEYNYQNQ